jgi:hypothetical protein
VPKKYNLGGISGFLQLYFGVGCPDPQNVHVDLCCTTWELSEAYLSQMFDLSPLKLFDISWKFNLFIHLYLFINFCSTGV